MNITNMQRTPMNVFSEVTYTNKMVVKYEEERKRKGNKNEQYP